MTSRERVRRLLNGQPADRIPNGLGGCETMGMHVKAYDHLKKILGIENSSTRMYTFMANAVFELPVLNAMGGDIAIVGSKLCSAPLWGKGAEGSWTGRELFGKEYLLPSDWNLREDEDGTLWWDEMGMKCPPGGLYFDWVPSADSFDYYVSDNGDRPSPEDYNPPADLPDELLRGLEESAGWLYENTDLSLCCGEVLTALQVQPGGWINWCVRMREEPEVCREFLDKACEASLSQMKLLEQAIGKYCDIICMADDMGDNHGLLIGPELWRDIFKPAYKKLFSGLHKISGMKINLHSCGSIYDIMEDLIECGLDIINPIQVSARDMEPEKLKNRFGGRIIFAGGSYDAALTPPGTAPEIVYEAVKKNISALSRGGGYIFAGEHNMPGDTPESHVAAIMAAYRDCCNG